MHFSKFYCNQWCSAGLSPLLFAILADVLLRRLKDKLPDSLIRAFADDTAIVTADFAAHAVQILGIFNEFACISNLQLNLTKNCPDSSMGVISGCSSGMAAS